MIIFDTLLVFSVGIVVGALCTMVAGLLLATRYAAHESRAAAGEQQQEYSAETYCPGCWAEYRESRARAGDHWLPEMLDALVVWCPEHRATSRLPSYGPAPKANYDDGSNPDVWRPEHPSRPLFSWEQRLEGDPRWN